MTLEESDAVAMEEQEGKNKILTRGSRFTEVAMEEQERKNKILTRGSRFTEGYLSRLRAGDGVPGAPLLSLLALLAAHPQLIAELEVYWTLPPA